MKHLILIILLSVSISCENKNESKQDFNAINNIDWLMGDWVRINDKPNKKTSEYWNKISNTEYTGLGITLEGADTTFREDLKIVHNDKHWVYEVRGVNENMTPFVFTEITESSFVCENEKNEFPKIISYKRVKDTLFAKISADDVSIEFNFIKQ